MTRFDLFAGILLCAYGITWLALGIPPHDKLGSLCALSMWIAPSLVLALVISLGLCGVLVQLRFNADRIPFDQAATELLENPRYGAHLRNVGSYPVWSADVTPDGYPVFVVGRNPLSFSVVDGFSSYCGFMKAPEPANDTVVRPLGDDWWQVCWK